MTDTAARVLAHLQSRPELEIREDKPGQYRFNSPFRPGSNSHAFTLTINGPEHGAYRDHNPQGGPDSGSLYDLAARLGIEPERNGTAPKPAKAVYNTLTEYAAAHGVSAEIFTAAGWSQTTLNHRPALVFKTDTGPRYRYLDGQPPKFWHAKGYKRCWYRLAQAVDLAQRNGQPLVICNGEGSTVASQSYGLAAAAVTSGTEKATIPPTLLEQLQAVYTGPVIVALDCDAAGRAAAPKLAQYLAQAGYPATAVDLKLGTGQDLADFCRLHGQQAAAALLALPELTAPPPEKNPESKIKTADVINALQRLDYSFRMNVLNDTVEVNGTRITDPLAAEIRARMWDAGYTKYPRLIEDSYITEAARNPFHPIKVYLESLTYNGLFNIDTLAGYFTDKQGVFHLWFKKWLVGAVAKIYEQYQNPMLVLDGAQGRGKSHFAAWLCPPALARHFVEGAIDPASNDHKLWAMTTWLWEVSELGATTKKTDREALKAFITQKYVTARKPYGKHELTKPMLTSFIGTVNDEAGFLNDPTGSRRFLTCTLTGIDWDYTAANIDNIWAEAYHLYKSGYNYRLTDAEKELQHEINEDYETEEPLIAAVVKHYRLTGNNEGDWVSSTDILNKVGLDPLQKRNTMRLAQAMKKLGLTKKRSNETGRPYGYNGLKELPF